MTSVSVNDIPDSEYKLRIKEFLFRILDKRSGMKREAISQYLENDENMNKFMQSFTHKSYDPINNYEYYETLGDSTLNNCMVWYFHRRFPAIKNMPNPSHAMTSLKTNNVSRKRFADLATKMGLEHLIRFKEVQDPKRMNKTFIIDNKMKTDVFEAVMGCLEDVINTTEQLPCIGITPIYNILSTLMDQVKDISLSIEKNVDSKTKIMQMFQQRKNAIDKVSFVVDKKEDIIVRVDGGERKETKFFISCNVILQNPNNPSEILKLKYGPKEGRKILDAEQRSADEALEDLKKYGVKFLG